MKGYLLAHGQGTSGNKATLFDTAGDLVASIVHPLPYAVSPKGMDGTVSRGWVGRNLRHHP